MGTSRSSRPTRGPGNGAGGGRDRASEASRAPESTYRGRHCTLAGRWRRRRTPRGSTARRRPRTRSATSGCVAFDSEVGEVEPANRARGRAIGARDGRVRGRAQSRRGECECGSIARAVARVDPPPVAGRSRRGLRRRIFRASATKKIRAAGRGRVAHLRLTRASTRAGLARGGGYPTHPFDRTSLRRTEGLDTGA